MRHEKTRRHQPNAVPSGDAIIQRITGHLSWHRLRTMRDDSAPQTDTDKLARLRPMHLADACAAASPPVSFRHLRQRSGSARSLPLQGDDDGDERTSVAPFSGSGAPPEAMAAAAAEAAKASLVVPWSQTLHKQVTAAQTARDERRLAMDIAAHKQPGFKNMFKWMETISTQVCVRAVLLACCLVQTTLGVRHSASLYNCRCTGNQEQRRKGAVQASCSLSNMPQHRERSLRLCTARFVE